MLDEVDRKLLALLQNDGRITNVDMARRNGMAPRCSSGSAASSSGA